MMEAETKKYLYVGAALVTIAGGFIWLYERARNAGQAAGTGETAQAAAEAQAQQDQLQLEELAMMGGGSGASSVGTVSPVSAAGTGQDIGQELQSVFSALGINLDTPATTPSTTPASTTNPTAAAPATSSTPISKTKIGVATRPEPIQAPIMSPKVSWSSDVPIEYLQ